ncbi:DUF4173 domain-containing protein [Candidatus Uhrbacteria bacterium]|nr:DUF4173 domain-containing protein [Candidatus Uhrbacteria bacterium]
MDRQHPQANPLSSTGLVVGISLLLGLLFNYFFVEKVPGISFPIYVTLVVLGVFGIARSIHKPVNSDVLWLLMPLIFFSTMVFVRSSGLLTFLNIVASLLLLLIINEVSFGQNIKKFLIRDYLSIFSLPFAFIRRIIPTLSALFLLRRAYNDGKIASQVVKGLLITVPVFVIFALLFSSADLVFQKYVSDLIAFHIEEEVIARGILVLVVTLIFIGAYSYLLSEKNDQTTMEDNSTNYGLGQIESSILLGSVNGLFFLFILVQLTYLFGGGIALADLGLTYAEYARRGFFELITVAIISLLLLLALDQYVLKREMRHAIGFKILGTALVVQVMLIMASAVRRLSLYEEAYGLTTLRLYSHAFIILLAVVFCLLLYKMHNDNRENAFAFRVFVSIALFLVSMNILNPDAFIVRRNIERFSATGKFDAFYLLELSSDALPDLVPLLTMSNEEVRKSVGHQLYWRARQIDSPDRSTWQSFNLSRRKADQILGPIMKELELYKDFQLNDAD